MAIDMVAQAINDVPLPHPLLLPPGYRFHPTSSEIFRHYLHDRVTNGFCQWSDVVSDTDILARPPWDLPGMHSNENEGYYFYAREKKSKSAGYNRVIKANKDKAYWKMTYTDKIWEKEWLWGRRNTLNYYSGDEKTDWLMYEFVLDSLLAKGKDDSIVLCKVFKKKYPEEKLGRGPGGSNVKGKGKRTSCQESAEKIVEIVHPVDVNSEPLHKRRRMDASSSACFSQLTNKKTQFTAGASSSAAFYIQETHSNAAIQPSFAAEPCIEGIHPAEVTAQVPCMTNCADAAPVDDPKLCYQPPAAFGSADPYLHETHPAAVAEPCTIAASSSNSTVAPIDDPNGYYTEADQWMQQIQQFFNFGPVHDDFYEE